MLILFVIVKHTCSSTYVTGFTKTVPIGTRNELQFIADY